MLDFLIKEDGTVDFKIDNTNYQTDMVSFNKMFDDKRYKTKVAIRWKRDKEGFIFFRDPNKTKIYFIDEIFGKKIKHLIKFKDGNNTNLKKENLLIDYNLPEKYKVLEYYGGVIKYKGKHAFKEFNQVFKVEEKNDNFGNDNFGIMLLNDNHILKFDINKLDYLRKYEDKEIIWYYQDNGYCATTIYHNDSKKIIYMHRYLFNFEFDDNLTIDHINQDKLDNRINNLRLATQSQQNTNTDKKTRQYNAQPLPNNLSQFDLPKYVTYNKECYDKKNNSWREFFRIENHPKYPKTISSSKSNKISLSQKLDEIKLILTQLDNNTYQSKEKEFPLGISIKNFREHPHFILDYRDTQNNIRYNLKMKINNSIDNLENYNLFLQKINQKYPDYSI